MLLYKWVCLRAHGRIRMRQCLWHKAWPQLNLTLRWMPLWRQSDFVWPHTFTEEDMEKICGPVNLRDYVAPLSSGLNNALNPMVPCHCNLGLLFLEKKWISIPSHHQWSLTLWMGLFMCMCVCWRKDCCMCVYVKERGGMREWIICRNSYGSTETQHWLDFFNCPSAAMNGRCSCLREQLLA